MKKYMKSLAAVLLAFAMLFSFTGCGEIGKAEDTVNGMFKALKIRDFEKAQEYIDIAGLTENAPQDDMFSDIDMFMELTFGRLEHEIVSSELVDENTVNVTTKVTAVDMKPVLADFFALAIQYALGTMNADPQPTEDEVNQAMKQILAECASATDLATVTNEVVIKVTKQDGDWRVDSDGVLVDAMLGGLSAAVAELEGALAQ